MQRLALPPGPCIHRFSCIHTYELNTVASASTTMDSGTKCYTTVALSSPGLWLAGSPFAASVPLLLAQIATIVALSQALHSLLRRFSQPIVVSQILTGLILGPSGLGHLQFFKSILFSGRSWIQLNIVALIGLVLFRFIIGLKTDATMLKRTRNQAIMIALASRATPVFLILTFKILLAPSLPKDIVQSDILTGICITWTLSSFIVITFLLNELNLLNSKIGRLAISASLLDNLVDILFHLLSSTLNNTADGSPSTWLGVILSLAALLLFMLTVARPVALWIIKVTPEGAQVDEKYFVGILVLALGCGLFSELIGYHAAVGMLLLGLALPSGPPLGYTLVERLEGVITTLSVPVLMAKPGFISDTASLADDPTFWGFLQFFIILSVAGKFVGVVACAVLLCKLRTMEALPLGLIMCTKGFYEVELILTWQDQKMIDLRIASTFTISIAVIAGVTTPLIKVLYRPSTTYVGVDPRSIQQSWEEKETRVLACVHHQDNVAPMLKLLHSIVPSPASPMHLVVLHLVRLVGRATTVLAPYGRGGNRSAPSDRILNAFSRFAGQPGLQGHVRLHAFVAISPHATMHDDICTLAIDHRVSILLLPFHKGTAVNLNVIACAPCSVAILVLGGASIPTSSSHSFCNVGLYFVGGADDREALALCMHMAHNPKLRLTIFRLKALEAGADARVREEERLDEEMVSRGRTRRGTVYCEREVEDGEGLTTVIQSTKPLFDLLVVGRREGIESPLTSGLSVWSESPELGIIGDMLASTDFKCQYAILVVQHQLKPTKAAPLPEEHV